ncbi:TKL protein kinase [Saprolegnia parasitica CBS 223.65]|uniref:TKL protein kinase n=1 Tax=Saprolegnia parasitica (strain CBS 223.65) TaxID=695850 RepID=A0A067CDG9_SAPPC|nr:TKL protein kinase [Saprolegnia parasitica CBS 223.65]KDO28553.1 TKL protein kinase [Saprolegnia parasitica CBS 223.65]|eukprot:XP_012200618.1 TKL protein kinase [Saprolegnia parasitica CBS 223.65]
MTARVCQGLKETVPTGTSNVDYSLTLVPPCFHVVRRGLHLGVVLSLPAATFWTRVHEGTYYGTRVIAKVILAADATTLRKAYQLARISIDMHHPNIVRFLGVDYDDQNKTAVFVTEQLERGDLASILASDEGLSVQVCIQIMFDVACGMAYLHSQPKPIMHRDLRAANVHISRNNRAKVANFELSGKLGLDTSRVGTPAWTAPEILAGGANYTEKVDVYSFAMLVVEIMNRKMPYADESKATPARQLLEEIVSKQRRPTILHPEKWPQQMLELVKACWKENPEGRPAFQFIVAELDMYLKQPQQ